MNLEENSNPLSFISLELLSSIKHGVRAKTNAALRTAKNGERPPPLFANLTRVATEVVIADFLLPLPARRGS